MGQQAIPSLPTKYAVHSGIRTIELMHDRNFHELKAAIPAYLFRCNNVTSLRLLVRDIAMSLILAYGVLRLDAVLSSMNWEMTARQLLKRGCLSLPWMV